MPVRDWIKVETSTHTKPEVIAAAEAAGLVPEAGFYYWFKLWVWADANVDANGHAPSVTLASLSYIIGAPGFAEALAKVGWLRQCPEGGVDFVNWSRHNGKSAKIRYLAYERKRRARAGSRSGPAEGDAPVTQVSREECDETVPHKSESESENSINTSGPAPRDPEEGKEESPSSLQSRSGPPPGDEATPGEAPAPSVRPVLSEEIIGLLDDWNRLAVTKRPGRPRVQFFCSVKTPYDPAHKGIRKLRAFVREHGAARARAVISWLACAITYGGPDWTRDRSYCSLETLFKYERWDARIAAAEDASAEPDGPPTGGKRKDEPERINAHHRGGHSETDKAYYGPPRNPFAADPPPDARL